VSLKSESFIKCQLNRKRKRRRKSKERRKSQKSGWNIQM